MVKIVEILHQKGTDQKKLLIASCPIYSVLIWASETNQGVFFKIWLDTLMLKIVTIFHQKGTYYKTLLLVSCSMYIKHQYIHRLRISNLLVKNGWSVQTWGYWLMELNCEKNQHLKSSNCCQKMFHQRYLARCLIYFWKSKTCLKSIISELEVEIWRLWCPYSTEIVSF